MIPRNATHFPKDVSERWKTMAKGVIFESHLRIRAFISKQGWLHYININFIYIHICIYIYIYIYLFGLKHPCHSLTHHWCSLKNDQLNNRIFPPWENPTSECPCQAEACVQLGISVAWLGTTFMKIWPWWGAGFCLTLDYVGSGSSRNIYCKWCFRRVRRTSYFNKLRHDWKNKNM